MEKSIKIFESTHEKLKKIKKDKGIAIGFVVDEAVKDWIEKKKRK